MLLAKKDNKIKNLYKNNLNRIVVESVLTSIGAGFSVSIITIFWNSIGMDQKDIGFVQMLFTVVILCLDVPMGYVADRFNRKILNIIGDIGVAITFVVYAFAQNIYMAIFAESLLGLFMAMTNGVDQSFIKFNCDKIDPSGNLFKKVNVKVYTARYIALLVVVVIGGFISKFSLRLAIGISFLPYFIGGILAFKIKDYNGKVESKHKNPIKDMIYYIKEIIKKPKTRLYMITYILGKEITHSQVFVFTPLLIMCGVPIEIVSFGWVLNQIMQIIGGKMSEKMIHLKISKKFAIPIIIEISWMFILIIKTNIFTVWLFAFNGLVHGLTQGNLTTPLQESVEAEIQTGVMSIASTGAKILYMPLVYFINFLGNFQLQYALIGVMVLFLPACVITYINLIKLETKEKIKYLTS